MTTKNKNITDLINEEISKSKECTYSPLTFERKGKTFIWNCDIENFYNLLLDTAKKINPESVKTRSELLASLSYEFSDYSDLDFDDDTKTKEIKERHRKRMDRLFNRILLNKPYDGGKSVASDYSCYKFLLKIEKNNKINLLTPVSREQHYFENDYIFSLINQLLRMCQNSDIYNYVPNTRTYQRICYVNHLEMIETNINEIFSSEPQIYHTWMQIIKPLKEIICDCNFPGFRSNDIWLLTCPELRFFDCTYSIFKRIKNEKEFNKYKKYKHLFTFDLGTNIDAVNKELEASRNFFHKNKGTDESVLFYKMLSETFLKIVYNQFKLTANNSCTDDIRNG